MLEIAYWGGCALILVGIGFAVGHVAGGGVRGIALGTVTAVVLGVFGGPFAAMGFIAAEYWARDYARAYPDTDYHLTSAVEPQVRQSFRVNMTLEDGSGHAWSDTGTLLLIVHFGGGHDGIGDPSQNWSVSGDALEFPLGGTVYRARLTGSDIVEACISDAAIENYGQLYKAVQGLSEPCSSARPARYIVSNGHPPDADLPRVRSFLLQPIGYGKGEAPVGPSGPS